MKTSRIAKLLCTALLASGIALGGGVATAPVASAAMPGWTDWQWVSLEACSYWRNQYAKKGYLVTSCVPNASRTAYSFQYKRQLR